MTTKKRTLLVLLAVFAMMLGAGTAYADWVDCDGFKCWIEPDNGTAVICGRATGNTEEKIEIPKSVTYNGTEYKITKIEGDAFYGDTTITELTVAEGITEIGSNAFEECSNLAEISLPNSLWSVERSCFKRTAYYNNDENWEGEDGVLYIDKFLIAGKRVESITVKDDTLVIADKAFEGNPIITSVSFPASVVKIGKQAFSVCDFLSQVSFEEGSRLVEIGSNAFSYCRNLTTIEIPAGVTKIEGLAFYGCSSLTEITIPASVTKIEEEAFYGCSSLTTVHFKGTKSQWDAIEGDGKSDIDITHVEFAEPPSVSYPPAPVSIDGAKVVLSEKSVTYNGKKQKPTVKSIDGKKLKSGKDYTIVITDSAGKVVKSPKAAGTYTVTVTGKDAYTGTATAAYKIKKAANTLKVKGRTASVKYSKLKKQDQTLDIEKVVKITSKGQGKITWKKASGEKKITINKKTGKVTLKKGLKKGTYKVKVKARAAGNANYKASEKTITIKITVK